MRLAYKLDDDALMSGDRAAQHAAARAAARLDRLEAEAVYILRELAVFARPALLFSGGKDSAVLLHLALKAFAPQRPPFKLLHIDTGHNFHEVIAFRDQRAAQSRPAPDRARRWKIPSRAAACGCAHAEASRNAAQAVTLLEAQQEFEFDALIGGARRDEERARAKERVFSHRDAFGAWRPRAQRPELWGLFNRHIGAGEHMRVFPISNWTEADVWSYIAQENIELPEPLLHARARRRAPRRPAVSGHRTHAGRARATGSSASGALPHRGRRHLHLPGGELAPRRRSSAGGNADRFRVRTRRHAHGRSRQRRSDGTPQGRGLFLMDGEAFRGAPPQHAAQQIRFMTAGSVDDGKSTLIGRLLLDSGALMRDQLATIGDDRGRSGGAHRRA